MKFNQGVYLISVSNTQDPVNGKRTDVMTTYKRINGEVSPVGSYTNWNAHSQKIELTATIQIKRRSYSNEMYIYAKHNGVYKLFEVKNQGKGARIDLIRLNCSDSKNTSIKEAIENELSKR